MFFLFMNKGREQIIAHCLKGVQTFVLNQTAVLERFISGLTN